MYLPGLNILDFRVSNTNQDLFQDHWVDSEEQNSFVWTKTEHTESSQCCFGAGQKLSGPDGGPCVTPAMVPG